MFRPSLLGHHQFVSLNQGKSTIRDIKSLIFNEISFSSVFYFGNDAPGRVLRGVEVFGAEEGEFCNSTWNCARVCGCGGVCGRATAGDVPAFWR
jgi:hypothetical protein